jgi:aspartate racemase
MIGLVGGLGVGAAIHYYRELAAAHERDDRPLDLVMAHAQMSRVFEHASAGDLPGLAQYLAGILSNLKSAGATIGVIPATTPHLAADQLAAITPIPLVNLIEVIIAELTAMRARRIALLGTRFVVETDLFGKLKAFEIARPHPDEITFIHDTYSQLARTGSASAEQHRQLIALAERLRARDGAEVIVLAGTDLSTLFNESNTPFPHLDCARAHIQAIMRATTQIQ